MALNDIVKAIHKTFGRESLMNLKTDGVLTKDFISSGSLMLDLALSGGIVRGRIVELFGTESAGKTTLAIHAMVEAQKYGTAVFIDTEHSFDPDYAENIGLDLNNFLFSQPETAEQAFEIIEALASCEEVSIIVIDSVANLSPKAEVEGDSGDSNMGLIARLMGQHLRKVSSIAGRNKTTIIYVNQIRMKIGVVFGNPETTPGGNALKYQASIRLDIRRISTVKEGTEATGIKARVRVVKNKTGPPLKTAEFEIVYGKGINKDLELFDLSLSKEVITKSGSWYYFGETKLGQGQVNSLTYLENNPEIKKQIVEKVCLLQ